MREVGLDGEDVRSAGTQLLFSPGQFVGIARRIATFAPRLSSSRAINNPSPREPPVTKAVRPRKTDGGATPQQHGGGDAGCDSGRNSQIASHAWGPRKEKMAAGGPAAGRKGF